MTGTFPPEIANTFSTLRNLYMYGNYIISGTLPPEYSRFNITLGSLDAHTNNLSGTLPPTLTRLTLSVLQMDSNSTSGSFSSQIGNLTQLSRLNLGQNSLSGTVGAGQLARGAPGSRGGR